GGVTETVEHGVTGFLVDDIEEARLAVERVATLRRETVRRIARERFSADRMVADYERAYRGVLAARSADARERPLQLPAARPVMPVQPAAIATRPAAAARRDGSSSARRNGYGKTAVGPTPTPTPTR
ncbi:MAG: hypothetical protein ACJ761_05990, partial [Chloroflexota bacterium]